jgi:hypothetical protein
MIEGGYFTVKSVSAVFVGRTLCVCAGDRSSGYKRIARSPLRAETRPNSETGFAGAPSVVFYIYPCAGRMGVHYMIFQFMVYFPKSSAP